MFADLVLEGGGVKGIALVGAISGLEDRGYQFRRVAGTSAGAVVGSLVAAGARAVELEEIMRAVDYRRFQDGPRWRGLLVGKAVAVLFEQGIYEGQFLKDWLGERLARLGVHTFADLRYDDPERPPDPGRGYRLVVTTCDISHGRLRRLPWEYHDYGLAHADQTNVGHRGSRPGRASNTSMIGLPSVRWTRPRSSLDRRGLDAGRDLKHGARAAVVLSI